MGDRLVSLKAAIDTLDKHLRMTDAPVSYPGIISALTEWLNELPSAQPDNQVHLCDSCKHAYPDCPSQNDDVIFGNDNGDDNICACAKYAPYAQPEISRIEQELHGKTPEEQYDFICWLLLKFALAYTDSRLAVVEWLRGEKEDG